MLQTYKATLRGDRLEWSGDAPELLGRGQAVEVHVTILQEVHSLSETEAQGKKMAAALEKLAAANALSTIADPSEWQREQRQERHIGPEFIKSVSSLKK